MVSIYSICYEIQLIEESIRSFSHPMINSLRTTVDIDVTLKQSSLEVKLYDFKGNYVIQDLKVGMNHTFPGLLMTLHPLDKKVRIESIYMKPEYFGLGIGTAFVRKVMEGAKKSDYNRICVVADVDTNAEEY
jgi:ribosomal protein S18 acetylase RimI-like enzyme